MFCLALPLAPLERKRNQKLTEKLHVVPALPPQECARALMQGDEDVEETQKKMMKRKRRTPLANRSADKISHRSSSFVSPIRDGKASTILFCVTNQQVGCFTNENDKTDVSEQ